MHTYFALIILVTPTPNSRQMKDVDKSLKMMHCIIVLIQGGSAIQTVDLPPKVLTTRPLQRTLELLIS